MAYVLSDLQSAVQDDLHDPSFSASRITRYLNYAQNAIFNTHMFRFCEVSIVGDLTVGDYTFDQQSNHQQTIGGVLVDPDNSDTRFILNEDTYLPHREFFELYPDPSLNDQGMPYRWTEYGDQIYFNCPVDKLYSFSQRYFRFPTALASASDVPTVPEAFRELLELYALYRSEKYRGNHDIAATYKQEYEDGLENMVIRFAAPTQVAPVRMKQYRTAVDDSL